MENTTVIQKLQAKKNKKGFTLVELVIVIAILAILAAIAIPVIVSTINSANESTFKSDAATVEMMVKAAINENKTGLTTEYNSVKISSGNVTIEDITTQNKFTGHLTKKIGNDTYVMVWDGSKINVEVASAAMALSKGTKVSSTGANTGGLLTATLKAGTDVEDINVTPETPTT